MLRAVMTTPASSPSAPSSASFGVVFDALSFMIDGSRFAVMAADRTTTAIWRREASLFVHPLEHVSNVTAIFFLKAPLHASTAELVFYMQNLEDGAWRHVCRLDNARPTCAVKLPYVPTLAVEALPSLAAPSARGTSAAAAAVHQRTPGYAATPEPVVLRPPTSSTPGNYPAATPPVRHAAIPTTTPTPATAPARPSSSRFRHGADAHAAATPTQQHLPSMPGASAAAAPASDNSRLQRSASVQLRASSTRDIEHIVFEGKMTGPAGLPSDPAELLQLGAQKLGTFKSALEASVSSLKAESSDQASLKGLLRDRWVKLTEEYVTWVQMTLLDPVKAPDLKSERRRLNAMADAIIEKLKSECS